MTQEYESEWQQQEEQEERGGPDIVSVQGDDEIVLQEKNNRDAWILFHDPNNRWIVDYEAL